MYQAMLLALTFARSAFGQITATLYNAVGCPSDMIGGTCTNVPSEITGCCASDVAGLYFWSGIIGGFGDGVTIITTDGCEPIKQHEGSVCLSTGTQNIYGITWALLRKRDINNNTNCQVHHADVYYIALPGEQRKPYDVTVVKQLDHADAIDWSTQTFNTSKLDVVESIIAQHGNGLNATQVAAIANRHLLTVGQQFL